MPYKTLRDDHISICEEQYFYSDGESNICQCARGRFPPRPCGPAINAGATVAAVTVDFAGVSRPQDGAYNIGAYESTGTVAAPTLFTIIRHAP
jgi:hypothetical protein